MKTLNIAAYKFVPLHRLPERKSELLAACRRLALRGTVLLSPEGINLFLAGKEPEIRELQDALGRDECFRDLRFKESWSEFQPFGKMLVKIKPEIVPLGENNVSPVEAPAPRLSPPELKEWLDQGRDVVLLDARNAFEVNVGTFNGARHLGLANFRSFPEAVDQVAGELKDKIVVTFCTGGIRCEKAAPVLMQKGFRHVYQLDGGILKYFEECGSAHFDGRCFVFDERTALDFNLEASSPREAKETGLA